MTRLGFVQVVVVAAVVAMAPLSADAQSDGINGEWRGTLGGQALVVVFGNSGAATINGEAARYAQSGSKVTVATGDGEQFVGNLANNRLTFSVEGTNLVLTRVAGAATPAKPSGGAVSFPAFKPKKVLTGTTHQVAETKISFTMPKGFTGEWTEANGGDVFAITKTKGSIKDAGVILTAKELDGRQKQQPPADVIRELTSPLTSASGAKTTTALTFLSVGGAPGGRAIVESKAGKSTIEVYAVALVVNGWAVIAVGMYPSSESGTYRPVVETVVSTLRGQLPDGESNGGAAGGGTASGSNSKLAGCWSEYVRSTSGGSSSRTLRLYPNGSYNFKSRMSFGSAGGQVSEETGRWTVEGNRLSLVATDGSAVKWTIGWKGSRLLLDGVVHTSCQM